MRPNVIFLDLDGVLITRQSMSYTRGLPYPRSTMHEGHRFRNPLDTGCVRRMNRLVCEADADVVLTSTYRTMHPVEVVSGYLQAQGCKFGLVGSTPLNFVLADDAPRYRDSEWSCRGQEIERWRSENNDTRPFVILDDDSDMGPYMDRLVWMKNRWGLRTGHVAKALRLLRG